MKIDATCPKTPLKGELLCKMVDRYPSIDLSTIQALSHIQAIGKSISMILNNDLADHGLTEGKFYVLCFLFTEELIGHQLPALLRSQITSASRGEQSPDCSMGWSGTGSLQGFTTRAIAVH